MQRLQGIADFPGVAIGEALVLDSEGFRIPRRFVARDVVDDEVERLGKAFQTAGDEIARNRDAIAQALGEQDGAIFKAPLQRLLDSRLRAEIEPLVCDRADLAARARSCFRTTEEGACR